MVHGLWQLAKLSLTADVRRSGTHSVRFGLAIVLYCAVVYANYFSRVNATGLPLFQAQLFITAFFLSAIAVFGFSQTITEEKEEDTLGLMRLADISPLAIILGKGVGILVDSSLLIAIQIPFTVVAITLGGVSWGQVYAAYVALAAYLWLLAAVGITASFGVIVGCVCLICSWFAFDRFADVDQSNTKKVNLRLPRVTGRRAWSRPIIWREYIFVTGGLPWTLLRIGVQFAIFFAVYETFNATRMGKILGFSLAWSGIVSGLFGLLDGTWFASGLFQDEVRYRTWPSLVQLSDSLSRLVREKILGWGLGLAPTILSPFLFIGAMMIFHEHIQHNLGNDVEMILGTTTIGVSVFGYLTLLVLLSLYFGWKSIPMTLTICFGAGWLYVVAVYTSRLDGGMRCALFAVTSLAIVGLMIVFHLLILKRLAQLAETT